MKSIKKSPVIFGLLSLIALFAFARQEKVLQIFRNGEIIQEYAVNDIDYIEVNDLIPAPTDINASVTDNRITIKWNAVEGATYNVYRSPDNVNFTLLASKLTETTYTDTKPLNGSNFYRVKAVVGDVESGYTASAAATLTNSELENGVYLGITGFNEALYEYPIIQLTESSVDGFRNFVDGLSKKDGTLLYHSVNQALNTMQSAELPANIKTAAIVTFTDGLDEGSFSDDYKPPYKDDMEYLDAINKRLKTETVAGQPITAFSIGLRGSDVTNIQKFNMNISKLASSDENAMEISSATELNAKLEEIADKLNVSRFIQQLNLKIAQKADGTIVRFTFDNVSSAENSKLYIEGTYNSSNKSLENVTYEGLTSTSGTTVPGEKDGIFVRFRFEGVHTNNNIVIAKEFTDKWIFDRYFSIWEPGSESEKTEESEVLTEKSSAVIMLVLDCSSSLADDFVKVQTNAKDFISTLYKGVGGTENPGEQEETIYSTTPQDLSVAIWKDGKRYFLTPEQYKNANLSNATVEGLTILSSVANFIISPALLQSGRVPKNNAMIYYENFLPDKTQATVISARCIDINDCLSKLGWSTFGTGYGSYYMTRTPYNDTYNYQIYLYEFTGGNLAGDYNSWGYIRGVVPADIDGPVVWNDPDDLKLSVRKDGQRILVSNPNEDLSQYDEVEGVFVSFGGSKFIIKLHNEQSGQITKESAMALYSHILPDKEQATIISLRYIDINAALEKWGGDAFSYGQGVCYMTRAPYNATYNYQIYLYGYAGGELAQSQSTMGYIRGVIVP